MLIALAAGACSDRANRGRDPIEIPAIRFPDAGDSLVVGEPTIDSPCPDSCALGACDGDVCRRCLLAIDEGDDPAGQALDEDRSVTLSCGQMAVTTRMAVVASGEVDAPPECRSWRGTLILARGDTTIFGRIVIADTDPDHSVYLEGMASSSPNGELEVRLGLGDRVAEPPDCPPLRLRPGFTITVAPVSR